MASYAIPALFGSKQAIRILASRRRLVTGGGSKLVPTRCGVGHFVRRRSAASDRGQALRRWPGRKFLMRMDNEISLISVR